MNQRFVNKRVENFNIGSTSEKTTQNQLDSPNRRQKLAADFYKFNSSTGMPPPDLSHHDRRKQMMQRLEEETIAAAEKQQKRKQIEIQSDSMKVDGKVRQEVRKDVFAFLLSKKTIPIAEERGLLLPVDESTGRRKLRFPKASRPKEFIYV